MIPCDPLDDTSLHPVTVWMASHLQIVVMSVIFTYTLPYRAKKIESRARCMNRNPPSEPKPILIELSGDIEESIVSLALP